MATIKHEWLIEKRTSLSRSGKWALLSRVIELNGEAYVGQWQLLSYYPTRKAAVTVGMIMRERGERISWPGGAIRMGIATVEPCDGKAMVTQNYLGTTVTPVQS